MNNITLCQRILLKWMCIKNSVSYDAIKSHCEYLNIQYNLQIERHPAWKIFLPLFMNGNVDYCDNNRFKVTEPILICGKNRFIFTNILSGYEQYETDYPYIFRTTDLPNIKISKQYNYNITAILKEFPSVDNVVSNFQQIPFNDFSLLKFDDEEKNLGIANRIDNESIHYFIYPNRKIVEVPNWNLSPDAINISYSYSRKICGKYNGYYKKNNQTLYFISFRIPIMIYRVLLIESLLNGYMPYQNKHYYIFQGITINSIKQINRILLNTISYYE